MTADGAEEAGTSYREGAKTKQQTALLGVQWRMGANYIEKRREGREDMDDVYVFVLQEVAIESRHSKRKRMQGYAVRSTVRAMALA